MKNSSKLNKFLYSEVNLLIQYTEKEVKHFVFFIKVYNNLTMNIFKKTLWKLDHSFLVK